MLRGRIHHTNPSAFVSLKMKPPSLSLAVLLNIFFYTHAFAADTASVATTKVASAANAVPANPLQIIFSLVVVVGILIGLAVLFKKFGLNRMSASAPVKIVGAIHIGNNQRIMVMEAGEEWVVLGVTPHHISTLTTMPRQEDIADSAGANAAKPNLPAWLQRVAQNYQVKK